MILDASVPTKQSITDGETGSSPLQTTGLTGTRRRQGILDQTLSADEGWTVSLASAKDVLQIAADIPWRNDPCG
jgi:hypothetical protein